MNWGLGVGEVGCRCLSQQATEFGQNPFCFAQILLLNKGVFWTKIAHPSLLPPPSLLIKYLRAFATVWSANLCGICTSDISVLELLSSTVGLQYTVKHNGTWLDYNVHHLIIEWPEVINTMCGLGEKNMYFISDHITDHVIDQWCTYIRFRCGGAFPQS